MAALNTIKEMLRHLSNRFKNFAEVTVVHILESHKNATKEVSLLLNCDVRMRD